jgi:ligand-binding SRPBCC domain-containing protein
MQIFKLETTLEVPQSPDVVFPFFADACNLDAITPKWLHFKIVTPTPIDLAVGVNIDYKLRIRGLPIQWKSEITAWEPPYRFIDEQRRGPYRQWIHEHRFEEHNGRTRIHDRVDYAVPGGALINKFFVLPELKRVFAYRHTVLRDRFGIA